MFRINRQLPSQRCEICHQEDLFDPASNYCHRCVDLELPAVALTKEKGLTEPEPISFGFQVVIIFGGAVSILLIKMLQVFWPAMAIGLIWALLVIAIIEFLLLLVKRELNRPTKRSAQIHYMIICLALVPLVFHFLSSLIGQ